MCVDVRIYRTLLPKAERCGECYFQRRSWWLLLTKATKFLISWKRKVVKSPLSFLLSGFWIFVWTLPSVQRKQPNPPLPHWPAASPQLTGRHVDPHWFLWSVTAAVAARPAVSTEPICPPITPSSLAWDGKRRPTSLPTQGMGLLVFLTCDVPLLCDCSTAYLNQKSHTFHYQNNNNNDNDDDDDDVLGSCVTPSSFR